MTFLEAVDLGLHIQTRTRDLLYERVEQYRPGEYAIVLTHFDRVGEFTFYSHAHFEDWWHGKRLVTSLIQQYGKGA